MTASTASDRQVWLSAEECNGLARDEFHFGSTLDNLAELYHVSGDLPCWLLERIDAAQVDPSQLIDDPDDHKGHVKVAGIRAAVARGDRMPPVIVIHHSEDSMRGYFLIEGRHRYNAAAADKLQMVAWVAHIGCCGGPPADLLG